MIYDPLRHRYFQIDRAAMNVLANWTAGPLDAVLERICFTGEPIDRDHVETISEFFTRNGLTEAKPRSEPERWIPRPLLTASRSYLFLRIPLLRPQAFLDATQPVARVFFSRVFLWLTAFIGLALLPILLRQTDAFLDYARTSVSFDGALTYVAALIFVKALHELGHAYQAALRGARVASMGVAFMVMLPLLYTDVSDAWRLKRRRDRIMVDAGGILVELVIAVYATVFWIFLPDGPARSMAFATATTGWLLSLVINLNPFLRFDGYYLLSDATGIHNLQPRAFAIFRWWLRECLFNLCDAAPEPLAPRTRRLLIWYASLTVAYRLLLFISISILVYAFFFKALGIVLLVATIVSLIVRPLYREAKEWTLMRQRILSRRRSWISAFVVIILIASLFVPMRQTLRLPAMLTAADRVQIFPPHPGKVIRTAIAEGKTVDAGDVLIEIASPTLIAERHQSILQINLLERRFEQRVADMTQKSLSLVLEEELARARAHLDGIDQQIEKLTLRAPLNGALSNVASGITPGRWIATDDRMAFLSRSNSAVIMGYVSELERDLLKVGTEGVFIPDDPLLPKHVALISQIDAFAEAGLTLPALTVENGGLVPVEERDARKQPLGAWFGYQASLKMPLDANGHPAQEIRGVLRLRGPRRSLAARAWQRISNVLIREAGG